METKTVQNFIAKYNSHLLHQDKEHEHTGDKIHVDEIASKVAVFYEKIRNVIDYREEHLLRKNTIERILRRRIFLKDFDNKFAEPLIKELIRSGHLSNDSVEESKIAETQKIIDNLIYLIENGNFGGQIEKEKMSNWLISISVSALEEKLSPPIKETLLSQFMFETIKGKLITKNLGLSEQEIDFQLFLAVQKSLFRPEKDQLQFRLMKFAGYDWWKFDTEEISKIAQRLPGIKKTIAVAMTNDNNKYFLKMCQKEKVVFQSIGDLVFREKLIEGSWNHYLEQIYEERLKKLKQTIKRIAILSIASFFISKILIAFAIEIPLDLYLFKSFSIESVAVNIMLPPLLMMIVVAFIKMPSKENVKLIEKEVEKVIEGSEEKKYIVTAPKNKGLFINSMVHFAYFVTLVLIIYLLSKLLQELKFSPPSIVIFLIFTSVVTATGVKIHNRSKELSLEKTRPSIISFFADLIIVPFMIIGKWTISGLSKFNILVIIFNFLIELPIQLFVEFLENFRSFIKEKKEEGNM
jgi:hypothetical protein